MKRIFIVSAFVLLPCLMVAQTLWKPVVYNVSFKIKNAGLNVNGKFTGLSTELFFSPDKLAASKLKGSVQVSTINTGIGKRDKDLQQEKYFNAGKYKLIEVSSTSLYKKGSQYAGMFNVTIKGVTKKMEIPFDFKETATGAEFRGSLTISRKDFGIGGPTLTMSDEAKVSIFINAKK